jgi:integrase
MPYLDKTSGKYRATKMINGVRRTKSFKTKAEAKKWEAHQSEESWVEEQQSLDSTSLLEWSVRYLEYSKERHTPKTYKSEKLAAFIRLFAVVDRDTLVDDLTVADCLRVLDKQAKDRSGNAANKDKKNLKAAWNWGVKYLGMPKDNPFAEVDSFPAVKRPRYVPPQDDFWKVFDVAEGEDKVLLLAFLHTAARRNELLSLKWDDVDLESGKIRLWTRKRKGGAFEYDWLPLTAELAGALTEHAKSKRSEYVFCDRDGMPYAERQRLIPRLCKEAGVRPFTYHAIRHLTASILAQARMDIPTIQKMLRHKNSLTTTIYLHSLGIMKNELDKAFSR